MVLPLLIVVGVVSYLAGEVYKRYVPTEQKQNLENKIKMHHGEAGILMLGAGLLTKSPNLAASGVGLILHDRDDYKKWFTGDKL